LKESEIEAIYKDDQLDKWEKELLMEEMHKQRLGGIDV